MNHYLSGRAPEETGAPGLVEVHLASVGSFVNGTDGRRVNIDREFLEGLVRAFEEGELGQDPPVKLEHEDDLSEGAAGWIRDLYLDGDDLKALVEFSVRGRRAIEEGLYRYLSIGVDDRGVLEHAALTAKPAVPGLEKVRLSRRISGAGGWTLLSAEPAPPVKETPPPAESAPDDGDDDLSVLREMNMRLLEEVARLREENERLAAEAETHRRRAREEKFEALLARYVGGNGTNGRGITEPQARSVVEAVKAAPEDARFRVEAPGGEAEEVDPYTYAALTLSRMNGVVPLGRRSVRLSRRPGAGGAADEERGAGPGRAVVSGRSLDLARRAEALSRVLGLDYGEALVKAELELKR